MTEWHGGKKMKDIVVYSKDNCPFCVKAKTFLENLGVEFQVLKVGKDVTREELLEVVPNARSVPQITINGEAIGGYDQLVEYVENTNFNNPGWTL